MAMASVPQRVGNGVRTFYALATAQTVSQIGSNMSFLAVGIYLYQQTGQATPLALLSTLLLLPKILAGGVAGVLADRYDRRTLMIVGDTGAALASVALLLSLSSGAFEAWHVYVATLWQALFSTLQRPAFEASVSQLVPEGHRHRANAFTQLSGSTALLASSALTGVLYVVVGVVGIFLIDLVSFGVGVVTTLLVRIPMPPRTAGVTAAAGGSMLSAWRAGLQFLWARRPLFILIVQTALFGFFIGSSYALTTPYLLARTGSEPMLGILTTVLSVGGLVGAVVIGAWGGFKRRVDTILGAMAVVLAATVLFGTEQPPLVMAVTLFTAMMHVAIANTMSMTLLQAKVPGEMQGRVFAIYSQMTLMLAPLGYLLIGPLADRVFTPLASSPAWADSAAGRLFGVGAGGGMGVLFAATGALALVVTAATYALPSVRRMEATLPSYGGAADGAEGAQG